MKQKHGDISSADEPPEAKISRRRRFSVIWIVPIVAGLIAAWLVYKNLQQSGPAITIRFSDGSGLLAGHTVIRYRGVQIGEVSSVELTSDDQAVEVHARLEKPEANFARDGAAFWVIRADVASSGLHGLDTIVAGPYIQAQPGDGPKKKKFIGLEQGPIAAVSDGGLDITLTWPQLGWLNAGAPLYYRGVEVGIVQDYRLGDHATNIVIHAHIQPQYSALVRADSKFWNAGGIKADISLLGGVSVSAESLKSLLVGGIAFATPSPPGPMAPKDTIFSLYEKPEDKWLKWSPAIEVGTQTNSPALPVTSGLKNLSSAADAGATGH
jgi:paraquat-inducible protein B